MIINQERRNVTKSGEFKTVSYGVNTENLALLFQMLRTNLYSDIYGSILRELVSNVIDSHTEAKKLDAFGEVQWVPENRILGVDAQLIIRDFGVGLSPDRMRDVYANYLSSTKRDDNDAIGGFGLGSKVPFAYTDSFFVKTVYDGVETQYLCYIDDSQLGAISEMHCAKVDLLNRTEIVIPVKKSAEDYTKFQNAIYRQLSYFQKMNYLGFTKPANNIIYEDQYCVLLETPPINDAHIVLGNVPYAIDFERMSEGIADRCKDAKIGIKFDIGELQPTLSREGLFWSDKVASLVEERIRKAQKSIRNQIEAELKGETDYGKWFGSIMTSTTSTFSNQWKFSNIKGASMFNFDGDKLEITNQEDWFAGHNVRSVSRNYSQTSSGYEAKPVDLAELREKPIFWLDTMLNARTALYLLKHHPKGFIVVSKVKDIDINENPDLYTYYQATRSWSSQLPAFNDIVVPDDEAQEDNSSYYKEQYKKLVQQRKLEGKFTAKELGIAYRSKLSGLDGVFDYSMYEGKFEEVKKLRIIYGFQEDHSKLCQAAGILTSSKVNYNMIRGYNVNDPNGILFLKIGKHYAKQFAFMHNAHYIDHVLDLKTPINADFARIASAYRIKEHMHVYHILSFFQDINQDLCAKYLKMHELVRHNTETSSTWVEAYRLDKLVINMCHNNLDKEMEGYFSEITDYFTGAELLKTVNFNLYTPAHRNGDKEGTTVKYVHQYVDLNKDFIRQFLIERGKHVDPVGLPISEEITSIEPDTEIDPDDYPSFQEPEVEEEIFDIEEEIVKAEAEFEQREVV